MTALAVIWDNRGLPTGQRCERMLAAQSMYARAGVAQRSTDDISFGRGLFDLVPEDAFDRGPISGGDGSLLLVADVRLDNREALAAPLDIARADLACMADPAIVMRAVERWGEQAFARLVGPFAVALWNGRTRRLTLARDVMGERPLHYHRGDGFIAAASMPKGLHALPETPYAPNLSAVADLLALIPETGPDSLFEGLERVLPGHIVELTHERVEARRFWSPPRTTIILRSDAEYAEATREHLDRAVARRLRIVDGTVGAHLSAGLDSAAVAATAARRIAPVRLPVFTAVPAVATPVPRGSIGDEGPLAAATAACHPNMDHVLVSPGERPSPMALLDRHFTVFERPVLNPSNAVWFEAINDAARARGVRVLLTGQMGNLTISHAGHQILPTLLRQGRLLSLIRLLWQAARRGERGRSLAAATLGPYLPARSWSWLSRRFGRSIDLARYSALSRQARADLHIDARAASRGLDLSYRPWANGAAMRYWGLSRVDLGVYNKGVLAAWHIDLRDPTADRDLLEFTLSVPEEQFFLDGEARSLARRAFVDRLPPAVLHERRRGLQGSDWHVGVEQDRGRIADEMDSWARCAPVDRLIDRDRLREALADWPDQGWNDAETAERYVLAMMRGVATGHFLRRVLRSN